MCPSPAKMPITHADGIEAVNPAGSTAASAAVPSRETIIRSTNCRSVKETVVKTIGPANLSINLNEVSSTTSGLVWVFIYNSSLVYLTGIPSKRLRFGLF